MAAGAIIGCVLGAAFATEAQRRGNREERKQREAELKNLEENLESLKVEKETKEKAAEVMEKAKVALEDKIAELEKFAAARGQEAAKEKETRERLVASLKARVKSVMDAISNQDTMEKEVLVKIMHNLLEEDLFGEKKVMSATDENTLSVSEHGNVTVKNTMASPARMFKLGSNRGTKVFQDSTNSAGGARFRIPLFSKQEQVVQPQLLSSSTVSKFTTRPRKSLPTAATSKHERAGVKPSCDAEGSALSDRECIVSPGKSSLIMKGGKRELDGKKKKGVLERQFKIALFDSKGKKENAEKAEAEDGTANKLDVHDVEYEENENYGSSMVITV